MILRQPRTTRTDTLFPYTTLFRFAAHRCAERRPIMEKARLMAGLFFVDLLPAAGGEIAAGLQPTLQRLYRIGLQALLALHDGEADLLAFPQALDARPEERRVGKECVSTFSFRGSPFHLKKKQS